MSHHLDTPLASQNGQLYIDDLYGRKAFSETSRPWPSRFEGQEPGS